MRLMTVTIDIGSTFALEYIIYNILNVMIDDNSSYIGDNT